MSLQQRGVKSEYLGSTQMKSSVSSEAERGLYDVLYMTPEKAISLPTRCKILSYKNRFMGVCSTYQTAFVSYVAGIGRHTYGTANYCLVSTLCPCRIWYYSGRSVDLPI
jgi:hypothetical protein